MNTCVDVYGIACVLNGTSLVEINVELIQYSIKKKCLISSTDNVHAIFHFRNFGQVNSLFRLKVSDCI